MKVNLGFLLASLLAAATAQAGTLTPPGAPAPTMKTLDEVEARTPIHAADIPLVINQPGSYYLAENIEYTGTSNGITISASKVTIDLNGFTLDGSGASNFATGIIASSNLTTGTTILNGFVSGWRNSGIGLTSPESRINNVNVQGNVSHGIFMASGTVIDCVAGFNGGDGIVIAGSVIPTQSIVSGCKTSNNGGHGIEMNSPGLVKNNVASGNSLNGIRLGDANCAATNNNCSQNDNDGINAFSAPNAVITGNNCSKNDSRGIGLNLGSENSTVKANNCSGNGNDGIFVSSSSLRCTLKDNDCSGNASDGIKTDAPGCRLISNNVSNNAGIGLSVFGASSIVLKNTSEGNGDNYSFVAAVRHGPIVVLGAGGPIASDHPWANFEY